MSKVIPSTRQSAIAAGIVGLAAFGTVAGAVSAQAAVKHGGEQVSRGGADSRGLKSHTSIPVAPAVVQQYQVPHVASEFNQPTTTGSASFVAPADVDPAMGFEPNALSLVGMPDSLDQNSLPVVGSLPLVGGLSSGAEAVGGGDALGALPLTSVLGGLGGLGG